MWRVGVAGGALVMTSSEGLGPSCTPSQPLVQGPVGLEAEGGIPAPDRHISRRGALAEVTQGGK